MRQTYITIPCTKIVENIPLLLEMRKHYRIIEMEEYYRPRIAFVVSDTSEPIKTTKSAILEECGFHSIPVHHGLKVKFYRILDIEKYAPREPLVLCTLSNEKVLYAFNERGTWWRLDECGARLLTICLLDTLANLGTIPFLDNVLVEKLTEFMLSLVDRI